MQERSQNFEGGDESEVTLAAPRFDADDARHAHPVVPLDEVGAGVYAAPGRARFRGFARRRWPLSFIVAALLCVAALGGVAATKLLRRAHTTNTPAPASADSAQEGHTQTDASAPQTGTTASQAEAVTQPQTAPASTAAVEEKPEVRAPHRAREERAARPRRAEEVLSPPAAERGEAEGEGVALRGNVKARDVQDEDAGDKDSRKASKHPKKGGARLVDVIVGKPRP